MSHIHPDDHSDQGHLQEEDEDNRILTYAPEERFRLGRLDVMCLVINRMIGLWFYLGRERHSTTDTVASLGTGIFMTPGRVMQGTRSTGVSLFFWLAGIIYTLAGTHVYIEYGLNIPRYVFEGIEQGIPRSGGDLNYVSSCPAEDATKILTSSSSSMSTEDRPTGRTPSYSPSAFSASLSLLLVIWLATASTLP